MKLWLLQSNKDHGYDVANGFVVRAKSQEEARLIASQNKGDEGEQVWLSEELSTCEAITYKGVAGVILTDFRAG